MNALTAPTLIIHNARIYTLNDAQPWAEAIAIQNEHILAVGDNATIRALAASQTELLDAEGRLVLPGLCDSHIHFYDWSLSRREVELAGCRSKAEMLSRIAARAAQVPPQTWITGRGWNETRWGELDFPTRDDLDTVTGPDHPAIFWRSDMHAAVANSAALTLAGIGPETGDPPGGVIDRDASGRPTGVLRELAIMQVRPIIPNPDPAQLDTILKEGMQALHRLGITAIHDQRMKDHTEGPRALAAYQRLRRAGQLTLRVNCNISAHDLPHLVALGLNSGFGDDYLRLGHVKVFTDGSLGSRTAWMLAPFEKQDPGEPDNCGVSVTPPAQMAAEFKQAVEAGFPISVHAIGDRANRLCLDLFAEVAAQGLQPPIPHRIEHVQIIDPQDLPRLSQLGLTASVQPIHATDDIDLAEVLLGERAAHTYNFAGLSNVGTLLALGSDAPVANENPFLGIHAAVCRQRVERMSRLPWYPAERLTLAQTLHGYTLGGALAGGWHDAIGSLQPGKRADLIMLDRNLFELVAAGVAGAELAETRILLTLFDGQVVHAA